MKKRIMSSLLVICMLFALMPSTAFAASTISKITLTIDAPATGKTPATTAKVSSTAHSAVEKVEWSGELDIDGTFMPRTTYIVTVTLGIKPGADYVFSDKYINATVNGKEADDVHWYAKDQVKVIYTFPQYGTGSTLTLANINIDAPEVGAKPATTAHLPSAASIYAKSVTWKGDLDSNGRFKAGTEYTAVITLAVKDGLDRKFSTNTSSYTVKVNGVEIDTKSLKRVSDKELIVTVEFERLAGTAAPSTKVLEDATVTVNAPEAGKTPSTAATVPSGVDYYVKNVAWRGTLDNGKFKSGVEYTATITLGIKSGVNAKFSDKFFDATVNGVLIDAATLTRVSDTELIVPVEFEKTPANEQDDTAYASTQMVDIDGKKVEFQMYALKDASGNDTNYIKVRDLALALNGTKAQFGVGWDGAVNLTKGSAYVPNGSENKTPFNGARGYTEPDQPTKVNGKASDLDAIVLTDDAGGGYTYYKLRDLGSKLGFNVSWSAARGVYVETNKAYQG